MKISNHSARQCDRRKDPSMTTLRCNSLLVHILILLHIIIYPVAVAAADIRTYVKGPGWYREVVIEGNIEIGDYNAFIRIIRENYGMIGTVYLFSPGGDFYEAMKIGRAMRALELASIVPLRSPAGRPVCEKSDTLPSPFNPDNCTCASAGFFIHIGSVYRSGNYLAVHRPSFIEGRFRKFSETDAKKAFDALQESAREYMEEMEVPEHVQEDVLGTPSDRLLVLDERTVQTYFRGELPDSDERKKNICSSLSGAESARLNDYMSRIKAPGNAALKTLSAEEHKDLKNLTAKNRSDLRCGAEIEKHRRIKAYERYFGVQLDDCANHDFTKWSDAPKYLGKQYHEILGEEKFDEEKNAAGVMSLKSSVTAKAPQINLTGVPSKPRIVSWINLVSSPYPSPEFIRRVVETLEESWGKSVRNIGTEWVWRKEKFEARLVYVPKSIRGAYLSLVIDGK